MAYTINGNSFSTYNMFILSSIGALDFPRRIGDIDYDWKDSNGVDAYVSADDLFWDGRDIQLLSFYEGSDLASDLDTFRGIYEGAESSLVTTFGSHTATLKDIVVQDVFKANTKALLVLKFWEPSVTVPAVPTVTGGAGVTLGGYDLYQAFGLRIELTMGLGDAFYRKQELSYGNLPDQLSNNRAARKVKLHLNGIYSSLSALSSAINNLHAVLRSANLKVLVYRGSSYNTYFADFVRVSVIPTKKVASLILTLRIEE